MGAWEGWEDVPVYLTDEGGGLNIGANRKPLPFLPPSLVIYRGMAMVVSEACCLNFPLNGEVAAGGPIHLLEEVDPAKVHIEGAMVQITINAYERDSSAKRKCLKHHGYPCTACTKTMADMFGSIGEGIMHVHH